MVKKTMRKGMTYRMRRAVMSPILNSGKTGLNVFSKGVSDVATNEIRITIMTIVTMISERITDQSKALFFFTLKIVFSALSMDEKT